MLFEPYGPSHWTVLGLFVLAAILLVVAGRRWRGTATETRSCRVLAGLLLGVQLPLQVYSMLPEHWDLGKSLPFQLCDLAWIVTVYALWSRRPWACGLLYYWGLTLTSQALCTPQLEFDFPHLQFIMFWLSHCLVVLAAIYMTWGLGHQPHWSDLCLALGVTVLWGLLMLGFNSVAGTNYLFVNEKPPGASVLDYLGPWPYYLFAEAGLLVVVWTALTLPWVKRNIE